MIIYIHSVYKVLRYRDTLLKMSTYENILQCALILEPSHVVQKFTHYWLRTICEIFILVIIHKGHKLHRFWIARPFFHLYTLLICMQRLYSLKRIYYLVQKIGHYQNCFAYYITFLPLCRPQCVPSQLVNKHGRGN